MERWLIAIMVIGSVGALAWGMNSFIYQAKEDEQSEKVDKNFKLTTQEIKNQTKDIDELLTERTPKFDAIIQNQKVLIHNDAQFAKQLNISGVSNKTAG